MKFEAFINDLLERIENVVEHVLLKVLQSQLPAIIRKTTRKEFVTTEELQDITGWSRGKIHYLRKEHGMPFIKEGRSVLFKMEDVEKYFDENRVQIGDSDE